MFLLWVKVLVVIHTQICPILLYHSPLSIQYSCHALPSHLPNFTLVFPVEPQIYAHSDSLWLVPCFPVFFPRFLVFNSACSVPDLLNHLDFCLACSLPDSPSSRVNLSFIVEGWIKDLWTLYCGHCSKKFPTHPLPLFVCCNWVQFQLFVGEKNQNQPVWIYSKLMYFLPF